MTQNPQYTFNGNSESEDELVFSTMGTDIDEAFESEDDVDECDYDEMDDRDEI